MNEVLLPSLGADMVEGTIVKWLVKEGDKVARGDKIAEIETDKTIVEMESYHSGILSKLVVQEGVVAPVGTVIAFIGEKGEPIPEIGDTSKTPTDNTADTKTNDKATAPEPQIEPDKVAPVAADDSVDEDKMDGKTIKASPMARKLARERNMNLTQVKGSGPGGRITRDDVLAFNSSSISLGTGSTKNSGIKLQAKKVALTNMRQAIAKTTVKSKNEIPAFQVSISVDITAAMEWRTAINEEIKNSGSKISVNDIVLKAVINALIDNPKWNATYAEDSLHYNSEVNIGVAIALEVGLMVPAILDAHKMSIIELSHAAKDIGKRTRNNQLTQAELTKGTFSTSNLGMFNVDTFTAIIVPSQSGILSVGSVKKTAIVQNGQIVIRDMLQAVLSADHRVGDGAEAGALLSSFRASIENPAKLFF